MKQLNNLRMKRFYLTLCFLMSVIGSAWGQETFTVTSDTQADAVTPGEFVSLVGSDGKVAFQFGASDITWKTGYYTIDGEKKYYYAKNSGNNAQTSGSNIPTGGYYYAFKATANGTINIGMAIKPGTSERTVSIYSSDNSTIYDVDGNSISSSTKYKGEESGSIYEFEYNIKVTAGITYYIYTTGTGNLWFRSYTFTPYTSETSPALTVGSSETATADNSYIYEYNNCSITKDDQLIDSAKDGSYVLFKVKPEVSGVYSFTSIISTNWNERSVTLSCGDQIGEEKIITPGGWNENDGNPYTWDFYMTAGQTYVIKVQTNVAGDVIDDASENNYTVNVFDMDIKYLGVTSYTQLNVADFNYNDGTSVNNGLDRKGVRGYDVTFTGNSNTPKFNGVSYGLVIGNGGTMTVTAEDQDNKIRFINFLKSTSGTISENGIGTGDVTGKWTIVGDSVRFTPNEPVNAITFTGNENSFAFGVMGINSTNVPTNRSNKITPTHTFATTHVDVNVGTDTYCNETLTTNPANFKVLYSIKDAQDGKDVATGSTIDEKTGVVTIGNKPGTFTVEVKFNGKRSGDNSTTNNIYASSAATPGQYTITVIDGKVAGDWDFTTWETADETVLQNTEIWEPYNSETGRYANTGDNGALENYAGLSNTHNGLTLTAPTGTLSIYYSTDGNGSIRLHNSNALINLPALTAGQTITIDYYTTSSGDARGPVFTGENADKLKMISGDETSKERTTVTYYVTEDISGASFTSSHNGLRIYSVELGAAQLYWQKNGTPVASLDVYEGTTTYNEVTLNNTEGVTYTVTPVDNGSSSDITASASGISVNSFTLGNSYLVTATSSAGEATLKVSMRMNAEISYSVTEAAGQMGFSFVEPVLTKNPAGLNVVKWKSSNPAVATVVADNGEVTFVSAGTTIITAYIEENNYYAYQEASYTLTVTEAGEIDTPWELSVVEAPGTSVATGSTGHKLTMTKTGTIKAGQVTTEIPGLTLSFGRTGDADWEVYQENDHFGGSFVAGRAMATLASDTDENASGYLPTGGTYLGLEPTVNGVLSLHTAYYKLQQIVVVDKETNTIIASRRPTDGNRFEDYEFTVPLQADHTYYVYNLGNPNRGDAAIEATRYAMPVNAITFTPVFLDRIGHVIVNNNKYDITGAQLADDIHDYPTFSNVHAEEGGSVTYESSDKDVAYFDEEGNLIVAGKEGTTTLQAYVSHVKDDATCSSVAECTLTYTKSQLEFSKSSYTNVDVNQLAGFEEPTLNYIPESGVTYNISGAGAAIEEDGNITALDEGTNVTVTATIADNLYYTSSASYTITTVAGTVPLTITSEITLPVGTRGYDLLTNGHVTVNLTEDDLKLLSSDSSNPENFYSDIETKNLRGKFYWNGITKPENIAKYASTDPAIAYVNNSYRVDAKTTGTVTLRLRTHKMYLWDKDKENITKSYAETYFEIKVNVVPEEVTDEYLNDATYRTWNFHNGFDATELSSYDNDYTALGNSTGEAENFITHIPSGHDFWIYDEANNTLKSNTLMTVEDNKIDRNTAAFIANEPMNNLSLTSTATNYFASSKGTIDDYRNSGEEPDYQYDDDDKNVLTFYTFRKAENEWDGTKRNEANDITFNAQTNMCGITGVDKDEHVTPYRSIQLSGKAAFIRVNDIKPGMWMSVIADNNYNEGVGFVQLASDGADVQAMGQSLYSDYSDSKDANLTKYPYNRVTNVFPYLKSDGKTVAIEQEGASGITNIMVGYPAGMGTLNVGGGEKSPKINNIQRTYGYATFVSPYNIDLTGQTALKAYICDYYGTENNLVHMVQIKHIPANTPVMLKGYARDMFVLYISEGNKDVDHGISEEVFAKNRLVGALEDGVMVQPTEEGLAPDGGVTTWHNLGLTQNKFLTFTVASPIAKGRAYLRITQEEYEDLYAAHVSATAASTSAKIVFEDSDFDYSADEKPTGIEEVETNKSTMGNGYYYNLNGVRINGKPTQKGIYILNGKKIVVR